MNREQNAHYIRVHIIVAAYAECNTEAPPCEFYLAAMRFGECLALTSLADDDDFTVHMPITN